VLTKTSQIGMLRGNTSLSGLRRPPPGPTLGIGGGIMGERVTVCEVGPRDGLQMAKTRMPTDIKIAWVRAVAAAGVPEIEVGSFVPARLIPTMADTGEVVRAVADLPCMIMALTPNLKGAQLAA